MEHIILSKRRSGTSHAASRVPSALAAAILSSALLLASCSGRLTGNGDSSVSEAEHTIALAYGGVLDNDAGLTEDKAPLTADCV